MRLVTVLLLSVALGCLAIAALLFLFQDRILFIPTGTLLATPEDAGLSYEDLTFELDGGQQVHGWFVPAREARGVILFCHGNAGNISHRLESIRTFVDLGLDVLIFDYEGYGRSTGQPSQRALYRDALAAWDHLTVERGIPPERILLFGRSMGAAVAAWLATQTEPAGLIVESGFTSVPDMAREHYPLFVLRCMVRHKLDTLASIQAVRCPVLIAHSKGDEIVPYRHGRKLFEAAPEPKTFLDLEGSHNDGPRRTGPAYETALRAFIDGVLPAP